MIDFDEEVLKFEPDLETSQAKEVILKTNLDDISDVLARYFGGDQDE